MPEGIIYGLKKREVTLKKAQRLSSYIQESFLRTPKSGIQCTRTEIDFASTYSKTNDRVVLQITSDIFNGMSADNCKSLNKEIVEYLEKIFPQKRSFLDLFLHREKRHYKVQFIESRSTVTRSS